MAQSKMMMKMCPLSAKRKMTTLFFRRYTFGLVSYNSFNVFGEEYTVNYTTGTVDAVQEIQAQYKCTRGLVLVSWKAVIGATSYTATAQSTAGVRSSCTTSTTSCEIEGLECGISYLVEVIAETPRCTSSISEVATFETVPCAPQNVIAEHNCQSNAVTLSWDASVGSALYIAIALGSDKNVIECSTPDTSCYFTAFQCGMQYRLTVVASNGECNSTTSGSQTIRTAIGALYYIASALGSRGNVFNCTSFSTTCAISGTQCGESLAVSVAAYDNKCKSVKDNGFVVETAPCTPQFVQAIVYCSTGIVLVTWDSSFGAEYYITTAVGKNGHTAFCNTTDTMCQFNNNEVQCGQNYAFTVVAHDAKYSSPQSEEYEAETVPCEPQNITTDLDCETGYTTVSWDHSDGALSYMATAESENGDSVYCNTTDKNCVITNLQCGHNYSVYVTSFDEMCSSVDSSNITFQTKPCTPIQVWAEYTPKPVPAVEVYWNECDGAAYYTAEAIGMSGEFLWCNTTETNCEIVDLKCGELYIVHVIVQNDECNGTSNHTAEVQTGLT
ncbi:fibronectin type III domain-containing protein 7-like [Latimeria chalumnae]|uniref:fibronectin type III domain-containing protein 7-like n=1 Tax=Latimeria chalumnae TaxID=7897 RepID=UPI00313D1856